VAQALMVRRFEQPLSFGLVGLVVFVALSFVLLVAGAPVLVSEVGFVCLPVVSWFVS
jgi:hypothetical protein